MSIFSRGKPQLNAGPAPTIAGAVAGAVTPSAPEPEPDVKAGSYLDTDMGRSTVLGVIADKPKGSEGNEVLDGGEELGVELEDTVVVPLATFTAMTVDKTTLQIALDAAKQELTLAKTTITGLEDAARGAVTFMQVALGQRASDLSATPAPALATEYASLRVDYEKSFPVGRSSAGPEDAHPKTQAGSSVQAGLTVGILPKDNN